MKTLKPFFLVVDIGFILYWLVRALHLIPAGIAFKDYANPILSAWNGSFLPLDLCVSASGMSAVWLHQRGNTHWRTFALISLVLTFCSGLQAIAFWAIRSDFDVVWWLPNLFLLIYPLFFVPKLITGNMPDLQAQAMHPAH